MKTKYIRTKVSAFIPEYNEIVTGYVVSKNPVIIGELYGVSYQAVGGIGLISEKVGKIISIEN